MAALREAFNQRIADLEQVSPSVVFAIFNFAWFVVVIVCCDLYISAVLINNKFAKFVLC